jgi:hypothetical protein
MLAYGVLMALDSKDFVNAYVRAPLGIAASDTPLVTVGGFMTFCGVVFLVFTLGLWLFKTEDDAPAADSAAHPGPFDPAAGAFLQSGGRDAAEAGAAALAMGPILEHIEEDKAAATTAAARGAMSSRRASSRSRGGRDLESGPLAGSIPDPASDGSSRSSSGSGMGAGLRRRSPKSLSGSGAGAFPVSESSAATALGTRDASGAATEVDADTEAETAPLRSKRKSPSGDAEALSLVSPAGASGTASELRAAYRGLWQVLQIPSVRWLILVLVTSKASFSAIDNASNIVMQGRGVTKETIALFDVASTPLQLALQLGVAKATAGPRPMTLFTLAMVPRLLAALLWLWLLYGMLAPGVTPGFGALAAIFVLSNAHSLVTSVMFIAQMSFFTKVSDPSIGGTYMTLLNTFANIGSMWPRYLTLKAIGALTVRHCQLPASSEMDQGAGLPNGFDPSKCDAKCTEAGGVCSTDRDGFLIMVLIGTAYGFLWLLLMRRRTVELETMDKTQWLAATFTGSSTASGSASNTPAASPALTDRNDGKQ